VAVLVTFSAPERSSMSPSRVPVTTASGRPSMATTFEVFATVSASERCLRVQ
jgi:hypothetical protein